MVKRKGIILVLMITVALGFLSCQDRTGISGVKLDVNFSEAPLTDRLFVDIQYQWKTKKHFKKISQDHVVYVHFWHRSNLIFYDNHRPKIPTSQWEAGKEYVYTRRIYIPPFIDALDSEFKGAEALRLSVGFFVPVEGSRKELRKIFEKKLKVLSPPLDVLKIVYGSGWYEFEIDPQSYLKRWRWTAKVARCIIDNPRRDALLVIRGGVDKEVFKDQKVIFKIDDWIVDEFIPKRSHFERFYEIKAKKLGEDEEFSLIITTDKTHIPAELDEHPKDRRELGVQISFIYFR